MRTSALGIQSLSLAATPRLNIADCHWSGYSYAIQLEQIRNYIQKPSADVAPLFVVSGGPGSGKTTLLSALSKKGSEWNCKIFFFHCTDANGEATGLLLQS